MSLVYTVLSLHPKEWWRFVPGQDSYLFESKRKEVGRYAGRKESHMRNVDMFGGLANRGGMLDEL